MIADSKAGDGPLAIPAQLDALFQPWNRSDGPGLVVGVIKDGAEIHRRCYGMASLESQTALTPSTRVRIGSTSKHFAALLALLLQEDGALDLDLPIRTYLPELTGPDGEPTLRLLLQHRGGSRCFLDLAFLVQGLSPPPIGDALRAQIRQTARNFPVGTAMIYNNGGYHLVSRAIERVGGASFEAQVKARLLDPLGLSNTLSVSSDHEVVPGMATLHVPAPDGGWRRGIFPSREMKGEAAIVSTLDDMMRWMRHLRTRDRFGSAESWRQLSELPTDLDGGPGHYALGLICGEYRGLRIVHHAGAVSGGGCQMLTLPDHGVDIVIITNVSPGPNPSLLAEKVMDIVVADHLGPRPAKVLTADHPQLLGCWLSEETGLTYSFVKEADELKLAVCGLPVSLKLEERGSGRLVAPPISLGEISVDMAGLDQGDAIDIAFGGVTSTYRKVAKLPRPRPAFIALVQGRYHSPDGDAVAWVRAEDDRIWVRFSGSSGSIDVELEQLNEAVGATATMRDDAVHFSVLTFHGEAGMADGFRLNSMRTRGLSFERI